MERQETRRGSSAAEVEVPFYETRHELDREKREKVVGVLNLRLADTLDLFTQCKQAHWNVKGADFYQLHELFDELAEVQRKQTDTIAERITALGGTAAGTARMAAQNSSLPEMELGVVEGRQLVESLADRFARLSTALQHDVERVEDVGDRATTDLLTSVVLQVDQGLYFLESHLQRQGGR